MVYFSYNDFMDYMGECDRNTLKETEVVYNRKKDSNIIRDILKNDEEMKIFLNDFLNFKCESKVVYKNNFYIENSVVCKIKDTNIFIFIKVLKDIDNNISYKMFENVIDIMERVRKSNPTEKYPIIVPVVIYVGNENWNIGEERENNKIKYVTFRENRIDFSYTIIKIQDLEIEKLNLSTSNFAKELIKLKNKYLQINQKNNWLITL